MEDFACRTRVIAGAGAAEALGQLGQEGVYLTARPELLPVGEELARAAGVPVAGVCPVPREGEVEQAAAGGEGLRDVGLVVALGDGEALDWAKALACFARRPLAALPTTTGSGAEVSRRAVLRHRGARRLLCHPALQPETAILDSRLVQALPPEQVAQGGFLLLANALESYVASGGSTFSRLWAREAFARGCAALPASYAGNAAVRLKLQLAAAMASLAADQSGLGLGQALAHSLQDRFPSVPLGSLLAILLPAVVGCNGYVAGKDYAELARGAGLGGSSQTIALENLKKALLRLRRELELPQTLAQAGVEPRQLWRSAQDIVRATLAHPGCKSNPLPPEPFLIRRILEEVTGRV